MNPSGSHLDEYDVSADALSTDPGNTLGYGTMIITLVPTRTSGFTESVTGKDRLAHNHSRCAHVLSNSSLLSRRGLQIGPDNNIWYALTDGSAIG